MVLIDRHEVTQQDFDRYRKLDYMNLTDNRNLYNIVLIDIHKITQQDFNRYRSLDYMILTDFRNLTHCFTSPFTSIHCQRNVQIPRLSGITIRELEQIENSRIGTDVSVCGSFNKITELCPFIIDMRM